MISRSLCATIALLLSSPAAAHGPPETVAVKFQGAVPNIPGKSLLAAEVTFPPGRVSPPHHHADSAFIYAYVLSGAIRSQVEGEPARIYHAGESWSEAPGAHHIQAQNMSKSQPAKLLAIFVVDSKDQQLTTPDPATPVHGR